MLERTRVTVGRNRTRWTLGPALQFPWLCPFTRPCLPFAHSAFGDWCAVARGAVGVGQGAHRDGRDQRHPDPAPARPAGACGRPAACDALPSRLFVKIGGCERSVGSTAAGWWCGELGRWAKVLTGMAATGDTRPSHAPRSASESSRPEA